MRSETFDEIRKNREAFFNELRSHYNNPIPVNQNEKIGQEIPLVENVTESIRQQHVDIPPESRIREGRLESILNYFRNMAASFFFQVE